MVAATPTDWLAIYGGYTQGIEETAAPPQSAINRDDATSASRTEQKETGIRLAFGSTRLVAGLFEIQRPYHSIDGHGIYGPLGTLTNRGVEASLTIQPIKGLSIIAGMVVANPRVSGEAVESGRVGPRAVGSPRRTLRLDANWQSPIERLSFDISAAHSGAVAASTRTYAELGGQQLESTPFTTIDIGARYRFKANDTPMALRGLASNIFDDGGYEVNSSQSFFLRSGRRFSLQLSADL
jgi:iron complex outermembrane receptor protein